MPASLRAPATGLSALPRWGSRAATEGWAGGDAPPGSAARLRRPEGGCMTLQELFDQVLLDAVVDVASMAVADQGVEIHQWLRDEKWRSRIPQEPA
jgi:hypothetical protein